MGLGTWITDAGKFAGSIASDVAPFVSHSGSVGPATVAPATQSPGTVPAVNTAPLPWYDQPVLVAGIAAGIVAVIIAAVVLTRK